MGLAAQSQAQMIQVMQSKFMELRWITRKSNPRELNLKPPPPSSMIPIPIYISTNPSDVNPQDLKQLYKTCNHSCNRLRFPPIPYVNNEAEAIDIDIDIDKLRLALSHSCVLVSLFSRPELDIETKSDDDESAMAVPLLGNLIQRLTMPVTPSNGQLVGFGRAVSDVGLTASIYDVMVVPSLRRMGIGRMIVRRIVRMLTSRDIYDIAALSSSEDERLFFEACGFGDDILGSTTMMYTKRQ